jgi:hypothetical protein
MQSSFDLATEAKAKSKELAAIENYEQTQQAA